MTRFLQRTRRVFVAALVVIAPFVLVELSLAILVRSPSLTRFSPEPLRRLIQNVYANGERSIIQFEADCARYDPDVTYMLRPGECVFGNVEFSNRYRVNSRGLRDDEASLHQPEIVVLGDSLAMGWGVEQDETFAQLLERETGMKTLNAAVSSFGTAREMRLFDTFDTSRLRYLVVQYHFSDFRENRHFSENDDTLVIRSERSFARLVREYRKRYRRYRVFKYVLLALRHALGVLPEAREDTYAVDERRTSEAALFVNALTGGGFRRMEGIDVLVLYPHMTHESRFVSSLRREIADGDHPGFVKAMRVLDLSEALTTEHHYAIDDHWTAGGHAVVAGEIVEAMKSMGDQSSG